MSKPVQLFTRKDFAKLLCICCATIKNRARSDPDFPPAVAIGARRIAYRSDDIAKYQERMQQRALSRPGIADPDRARESAALSHASRRANRDRRLAEQRESAARATKARGEADVPRKVPKSKVSAMAAVTPPAIKPAGKPKAKSQRARP